MAQKQYDATPGVDKSTLTVAAGSSIGASALRLTIDDANCPSRADALRLLEIITQKITEDTWPPA